MGRGWRARPPPFSLACAERPGHATDSAREATARYGRIALVGGDGTLNEVVNGLIADDRPLRPDLALGIVPRGTGGDFVRSVGIPRDLEGAAERLTTGTAREGDVGKVRYRRPAGSGGTSHFI